jgi:uncharacterized membrane protein YphA (DoxX/SURF4 family)
MDAVFTLGRLVLAGVFAFAGIAKLRDGRGTRRSLHQFGFRGSCTRCSLS